MTIDEIITTERDNADFSKRNNHEGSSSYHNQIAELLEELKAYRENSNGYNKEDIELNRNAMYNKAIDDFAEKLHAKCDGMINNKWNSNVAPVSWAEAYADFKDDIDEITEQLNGGGKNE